MENRGAFVCGLLTVCMAVFLLFWPWVKLPLWSFLLFIGVFININATILLMMGGIFNGRNLAGVGFGIGMAGWGLIVLSSIFGILICPEEAADALKYGFFSYAMYQFTFGWSDQAILFLINGLASNSIYTQGVILYTVDLCVGGGSLVLGSASFGLVMSQGK